MKVFIRSSDLAGSGSPEIVAYYDDNSDVPADAHGEGMTVLTVPQNVLDTKPDKDGPQWRMPRLAANWRERAPVEPMLAMEAKQRIEEVLTPQEQISTLHEKLDLILEHGTDVAHWPEAARERKAEIDHAWNYIREVKMRARSVKAVPANPASDKLWPTRIGKRFNA